MKPQPATPLASWCGGGVAVDFRLAVASTDMADTSAGQLLGSPLDPDTPALATEFTDLVSIGAEGSRDERGFDAALAAANPEGSSEGFARSEADLELVFFTDEDDRVSFASIAARLFS